jgi:hypothetical protein
MAEQDARSGRKNPKKNSRAGTDRKKAAR